MAYMVHSEFRDKFSWNYKYFWIKFVVFSRQYKLYQKTIAIFFPLSILALIFISDIFGIGWNSVQPCLIRLEYFWIFNKIHSTWLIFSIEKKSPIEINDKIDDDKIYRLFSNLIYLIYLIFRLCDSHMLFNLVYPAISICFIILNPENAHQFLLCRSISKVRNDDLYFMDGL